MKKINALIKKMGLITFSICLTCVIVGLFEAVIFIESVITERNAKKFFATYQNNDTVINGLSFLVIGKTTPGIIDSINAAEIGKMEPNSEESMEVTTSYYGDLTIGSYDFEKVYLQFYKGKLAYIKAEPVRWSLIDAIESKYGKPVYIDSVFNIPSLNGGLIPCSSDYKNSSFKTYKTYNYTWTNGKIEATYEQNENQIIIQDTLIIRNIQLEIIAKSETEDKAQLLKDKRQF